MIGHSRHNLSESQFLLVTTLPITPLDYILEGAVYEGIWGDLVPSPNKFHVENMAVEQPLSWVCRERGDFVIEDDHEKEPLKILLKLFPASNHLIVKERHP